MRLQAVDIYFSLRLQAVGIYLFCGYRPLKVGSPLRLQAVDMYLSLRLRAVDFFAVTGRCFLLSATGRWIKMPKRGVRQKQLLGQQIAELFIFVSGCLPDTVFYRTKRHEHFQCQITLSPKGLGPERSHCVRWLHKRFFEACA